MSSTGIVTNNRSMNGVISFDDGSGGVLENGQLTAQYTDADSSDISNLTIETNLNLLGTITANSTVITPLWVSYLYGLTGNIQSQISAIISNVLSTNNTWTGTNIFNNAVTFNSSVTGLTKSTVGLNNVDNTTDLGKPVSTATQTALNLKADLASPSINNLRIGYSSTQPTFGGSSCGGLAGNLSGGSTELDFWNSGVNFSSPSVTAFNWYILTSSTTRTLLAYLRTNGDFNVIGNITSPTITTINSNIALKANSNNAVFTGTTTGITSAMVSLGNCDNTSDLNKPISTATQTALNLKVNASGGTLTGGVANKLNLYNVGGTNMNVSAGNCYGTIGSNFSAGGAEVSIISSDYSYPSGLCCSWYTYTGASTYINLMSLNRVGNLDVIGTITSPTITTINSNIALKQDVINSSNRLDASNVGTGIVSNTEYNYLDGVTSAIQTQINTANTNISTNTSSISTINSTLTGYASAFTTTTLSYERSICGVDRQSGASVTYTISSMPSLTVLQSNCDVNLPNPSTLPEGQLWAVFLMGGYSTTVRAAGGGSPFWYAGGTHADFGYSNANKRKQFCIISSLWTILED